MKNGLPNFSDPIQVASMVAHQLKSPITSALTILQTLQGEFAGPLGAKQRELVEKAVARCHQSLTAAQRLLTITKAMDHSESFRGRSDVIALVHKARIRYQDEATRRKISLSLEISIEQGEVDLLDSALEETIEAILHNALKYTPDHGQIHIRVIPGQQPDTICLSISDSGVGIPEADRQKIFEPFVRTPSARRSARPGTGLGLTFAKAVVEAVGGMIAVYRSEFGGSDFQLLFPLAPQVSSEEDQGETDMAKSLRVIIIGGVAAGPKVAAKIMRLEPRADVTIIDKGKLLSYAGCGLPYYISGVVRDQSQLMSSPVGVLRDPIFFQKVKNVHIMNQTEALEVDRAQKRIRVHEKLRNRENWLEYDKLVLATGSQPVVPNCEGIHLQNIFSLHGVSDAEGVKAALEKGRARDVVILGGGLIGIEITEALTLKGCRVTIIEKQSQILPILDWEMAKLVEHHLESNGVRVLTHTMFESFLGKDRVSGIVTNRGSFSTDLAILALGIRPNTQLARDAGLDIGVTGGIRVDQHLRTSDPDIFAAGDCIESVDFLTGKPSYVPFGSNANKQGRLVAMNLCGGNDTFPDALHSVACKAFDYTIVRTGLTEAEAQKHGFKVTTILAPAPDKEHFAPGAKNIMLKLVVDTASRRLLGAQAIGPGMADKRIDVASVAIINRMTVDQIANLDLCYAPQFSPVMDNLITAANIARNKLDGAMVGITPMELYRKLEESEELVLLDVRTHSEHEHERLSNTAHIPLGVLRERMMELPQDKPIVAFCNVSVRGYEAALMLRAAGFSDVRVLDGGLEMWPYEKIS